jgi:hypothetical protein
MAFGQIDPARLEGDALRRWYLRSPEDLEGERLRRAERSHKEFYGGLRNLREQASPGADQSQFSTGFDPAPTQDGAFQVAEYDAPARGRQASAQARKPQATVGDCLDCHGKLPPLSPNPWLPPPFGKLPLPDSLPMFRDLPGATPSGPRNEGRKECELQERNDRRICGRQPTPEYKAICHASASERRAHCDLRDGTIGHPALDTAKRLRGNPRLRR